MSHELHASEGEWICPHCDKGSVTMPSGAILTCSWCKGNWKR